MFLLVFGIQEGHQYDWGTITGPISVWSLIIAGLVVFVGFVLWQARNRREPLVPLPLFRDRNFSLANVAISSMGFAITALVFPFMLYAQLVRGMSPTESAALLIPMALMSIVLAPWVGKLTDNVHPRLITGFGFSAAITSLVWLAAEMTPARRSGSSCCRSRCSASATRSSGPRRRPRRPATSPRRRPAPAPASTTPPASSAPYSVRLRSPCSWTPGSPPRASRSTPTRLPA